MKKYTGIENINSIIPKSIHAWGRDFERRYRCRYALHHWKKIVGENVSKNVRAVAVENKTLLLFAPDSTWRNEMQMFKESIIQKTNNFAGEKIVRDIRFVNRLSVNKDSEKHLFATQKNIYKNHVDSLPNLSSEENSFVEEACLKIKDETLRNKFTDFIKKQIKVTKLKKQNQWHNCPQCGTLCPPDEKICFTCRTEAEKNKRRKIRDYLKDSPWARYAEINKSIPCRPEEINYERAYLVQQWAANVRLTDTDTTAAQKLVMLYLCLPPEELNPNIVRETLYTLRNDLAKTEKFVPVKRYDYIKRRK